ncbi:hypothetical protein [Azohydromonas lata]|uniref:Uncharacterized protein n=1 Tax=Azohydromonas lata TaxID=45677 RepID=A0ABU5IRT3_9BURK|nr:hypothetical protein [Azohydromonas lata]MDZ5461605.1 hypothetical protein [Azohydromonas lata]
MDDDDDMPAVDSAIWQQGFSVGAQSPACACPFLRRSRETRSWLLGWEKGIQRLLAHDRRGEQATLAAMSALHLVRAGQPGTIEARATAALLQPGR